MTFILATVLEIAKNTSKDQALLLFYQDLAKAFKYIAVIAAFVYIWPIISMLAHICFTKEEQNPSPPQRRQPRRNSA